MAESEVYRSPTYGPDATAEELKDQGAIAYKRAQLLRKTTAGKQYLNDAKVAYIQALQRLGSEAADEKGLAMACTLHANLSLVYLQEAPPKWAEARACADIALEVDPKHVKSLFRRAQAKLEDEREGLPESALREALEDLEAARSLEPTNAQVVREAERVGRRLAAAEEARRVPDVAEIARKIPEALLDRGGDCLASHGYLWGQTESIVHVFVPLRGVRPRRSAVTCELGPSSLRAELPSAAKGGAAEADGAEGRHVLQGPLCGKIAVDDSSWQLDDGGLLLHVELAKRQTAGRDEHWLSVWAGHAETTAPSAEERRKLQSLAQAANRVEASEVKEEDKNPKAAEALKRMREMCPGVNVEWGDTSLDAWR